MKKHSKKFLAVFATILALACVLTACAPAATSSGKTESEASEAPASSKAPEAPVTLKYINMGGKPNSGNCDGIWEAVNEILLKDINVTLDVEYLGSWDASAMALKYAGNEKFDFAFTNKGFGFVNNAKNNAFREITMDELKEYAPYMVETLQKTAWATCSVGGKIYAIPSIGYAWRDATVAIRGDLREKYGLDKLKTVEDLEKYLELVAKNEPTMEASTGESTLQVFMAQPKGYAREDTWTYKLGESNPEIEHVAFLDDYLEYAKKMRSFYEKGIFPPDPFNGTVGGQDKFKTGISGAYMTVSQTINNRVCVPVSKSTPEYKVEMFNPTMGYKTYSIAEENAFAITRTSEHPFEVMKAVNHMNESVELQKLLNFGVEGVDYEMKDNQLVKLADVPADKAYNIGVNWNITNKVLWETFYKQEAYDGYQEIVDDLTKNSIENPLSAFNFDTAAVETEVANLAEVAKSYKDLFSYGMFEDVEGTMKEYQAALKDAGYEKVKAEYNRQAKEFLATYNK